MQPPPLLYRFMDERWGLESIVFRRFRVSRFEELNDPFEMCFAITGHDPTNVALAERLSIASAETSHELLGVICYSATASQPVLWAHYANNHQGMVFEVRHSPSAHPPTRMRYTEDRVKLDVGGPLEKGELLARIKRASEPLRTQKSTGWSYEEEYRKIFELKKLTPINGHYFFELTPHFLERVILGMKCRFTEDQIRAALTAVGLGSTSVVRAHRCISTYKVLF